MLSQLALTRNILRLAANNDEGDASSFSGEIELLQETLIYLPFLLNLSHSGLFLPG